MAQKPGKTGSASSVGEQRNPDIAHWPTRHYAAKRLGVHMSTLRRLQEQKELNPVEDADGVYRFDPDELDAYLAAESGNPTSVVQLISESAKLVKQATEHSERLFSQTFEANKLLFATLQSQTEKTAAHNERLIAEHFRHLEAVEAALSLKQERDLETARTTAQEERRTAMVRDALPAMASALRSVLPQVVRHLTGVKEDPQVAIIARILKRVDEADLTALAAAMKLDESEYAAVQELRGNTGSSYEPVRALLAPEADKPADGSNGAT